MRYLKTFKLFENVENTIVTIDEFLERIDIPIDKREVIIQWWNQNRNHIDIHLFPFDTPQPIAGVFLGENSIAVNEKIGMPPHVKLFLSLHESKHCDQHAEGIFMEGYYNSVVNGDKETFLHSYRELETDANDFAINSMREIGFGREMDMESQRLRGNEYAGEIVYGMMTNDINRLQPTDFIDLLKTQIGL